MMRLMIATLAAVALLAVATQISWQFRKSRISHSSTRQWRSAKSSRKRLTADSAASLPSPRFRRRLGRSGKLSRREARKLVTSDLGRFRLVASRYS